MKAEVQEITSVLQMERGATICYHVGNLAYDRGYPAPKKHRTDEENKINETADIALRLSDERKVYLLQRKRVEVIQKIDRETRQKISIERPYWEYLAVKK